MDNNEVAAVISCVILLMFLINAVKSVKLAKYESFTPTKQLEYDGPVYDLVKYSEWLNEKGALREGFGIDKLVGDYVLSDD